MAIVSFLMWFTFLGGRCRSQTDLAGLDALVERRVQPDECAAVRVVEIDDVDGGGRIVALVDELALRVLEGGRHVKLAAEAQEQRTGILGQAVDEVGAKRREIEPVVGDERGHAGAAVGVWDGHAVDVDRLDAGKGADRFRHLRSRDVLTLPAEGVADTVDEIEIAVRVPSHEVTGAKPRVARLEDAAQDLALGVLLARVPLESPAGVRRLLEHLTDRLADFVRRAAHAEARLVADGLVPGDVESHQGSGESMREERGDAPDGPGLALDVDHRHVALGRGVELQDLRNAEAGVEVVPDIGPQPVAAGQPDPVLRLVGRALRVDEIAAELADVLEQRAVPADHVMPELTGGELVPDHHGAAADQHRAGRQHAADAVVHRQAVVHPVAGAGVHHAGEPVTPLHQPSVADPGGLGQAGRARRIDVERPILDGRQPRLGRAERVAREPPDAAVDPREVAETVAVRPDSRRAGEVRQRAGEPFEELRGHDDVPGRDEIDGVRERGPCQIGVEQRNDAADTGDAEPDRHVLGPVRHEQPDDIPLDESLVERPAGVSVGARRETAIGQALTLGEQGRRLRESLGELLDHRRQDAMGRPGDRRRQLEGAQPHPGVAGRSRRRSAVADRHRPGRVLADGRHAVLPASTVSTVPVMFFAVSPSRNSTALATSSTSGRRRSALRRTICWRFSSSSPRVISVSRKPGAIEFTVTPMRPTSRASERVKPSIDALVAAYTERPLYPVKPMIEATLTIRPPPSAIMARTTYFVRTMGESVFIRTICSICALGMRASTPSNPTAALLTSP